MQISAPYDMGGRMRPKGTAAELERRRRRAMRLLESGHSLGTVARMVGTAFSAVWRWRETLRRHGPAGLAPKPVPGRPLKLTARQRQRLPRLLARGAQAHGTRRRRRIRASCSPSVVGGELAGGRRRRQTASGFKLTHYPKS